MCCCGGWEPHLLPRSDERKRESERGEQLTYPRHLTTCSLEKTSDGLLVYHLSGTQFAQLALKKERKKENQRHFCRCCSAIRCVLTVRSRLHRENLDRRDAPESAHHDRSLFSVARTWPTVGFPPGRKPGDWQHYPKTSPVADQLRVIFWGSDLSSV